MKIKMIAAMDSNYAIGYDNKIPWHMPNDLKRFKNKTLNQAILMGRKTAQSLPFPLPNRLSYILSSSTNPPPYKGQILVKSIDEAIKKAKKKGHDTLWIIGGQEVYKSAMPHAQVLEITHIHTKVPKADTFFPKIDQDVWRVESVITFPMDKKHMYSYSFVKYSRK